jgi:hypothetical protein
LENILKRFNRRALPDYRERGVRILYAAFGILTWRDITTNEETRSPLVMVLVELTRKSVLEPFTLTVPSVEEAVIPNPALQVKLRTDFKLDFPPFPEDGEAGNLTDYFNSVAQVVAKFGWKVEPLVVHSQGFGYVDCFLRRLCCEEYVDFCVGVRKPKVHEGFEQLFHTHTSPIFNRAVFSCR